MSHPSIGGAAMITNIAYVDASSIALMLPVPDAPTVLVPPSGVPLPHGKNRVQSFRISENNLAFGRFHDCNRIDATQTLQNAPPEVASEVPCPWLLKGFCASIILQHIVDDVVLYFVMPNYH